MNWLWLLSIPFLPFLFWYARIFVKRLILLCTVKSCCARCGVKLISTHPFWFFGSRRGRRCDFYLHCGDRVYAVKLWGMRRYRTILFFVEGRQYFIRSFLPFGRGYSMVPVDSPHRPIPTFDFRYRAAQFGDLPIENVLLVHPTCMNIRASAANRSETVGSGEAVSDFCVFTKSALVKRLEKHEVLEA